MKLIFNYSLVLTFCLCILRLDAQVLPQLDCQVNAGGVELLNAFAGGINTPQAYNIDMNLDGVKDVLILDRDGDVLLPYIYDTSLDEFVFDPSYQDNFGVVREWMVIRDYNGDGLDDMFTLIQPTPGIFVKKGVAIDGELHMIDVELGTYQNILHAWQFNTYTNIQVNFGDQPEIIDYDGDGDVDVLNFESGGAYVWYYRNYAVEKGLGLDTFDFQVEDYCWGKVKEAQFNQIIDLSTDPDECPDGFNGEDTPIALRHSGSTVTAIDEDGDGDLDLFLGDLENDHISFLRNEETNGNAWITSIDYEYPSYDEPIDITLFNAVFYTDVNNDGNRDLLSGPNIEGGFENHNCLWFYENIGTDESPIFELRQKDLFVEDMIDYGSQSSPAIVDVDADGLLDIVIGASGEYNSDNTSSARLILLKNIGSITQPRFEIADNDYLSFLQFSTGSTYVTYAPTFGDLDGDGDMDLIVADNYGYLYYVENTAGEGNPFNFNNPLYKFMDLQAGSSAKPLIYDLDEDGLSDLIIGELNGNINDDGVIGNLNFFRNIGTIGNPIFNPDGTQDGNNELLGFVNTFVQGFTKRAAAPAIVYTEEEDLLFVGSEGGVLFAYQNFRGNTQDSFEVYPINYSNLKVGRKICPAFADLNADGFIDMIVGNERGGLSAFVTPIPSGLSSSNNTISSTSSISIVPNPASTSFIIQGIEETLANKLSIQMMNIHSQIVLNIDNYDIDTPIEIAHLAQGTYILIIQIGDDQMVQKLVKM